ncbi:hypothetical protein F0L17_14305 [Streptomyces sp. TRM43335]|uniref:Uncharacterized protein n=1 Tax=Streptomyces taklimakanensis TaxID=2569853 RepID=A0A6G2BDD8_9ACTN|nr:hypothetical protein [Streptomyces taklimakanensis]MTE20260.1 hypothetical protein [Streptomyces taklimakanensis]
MRAHEIELLGGPADGQRITVPENVQTPPQTVELQELPITALRGALSDALDESGVPASVLERAFSVDVGEPEPVQCAVYRLDWRSREDDGSPWRYFYEAAAS